MWDEGRSSIRKSRVQLNKSSSGSYFLVCILTTENTKIPLNQFFGCFFLFSQLKHLRNVQRRLPTNPATAYQWNLPLSKEIMEKSKIESELF